MIKMIAETAWHHEGDFNFMCELVNSICRDTNADIVKMHITLDLDEYMSKDHEAYEMLKSWVLTEKQWDELICIVRDHGKEVMLLLNDSMAIKFASKYNPEYVEIHSVCLNVPNIQNAILEKINKTAQIVIGVGGSTLNEIDSAISVFKEREIILMFGFQNHPTRYEDINLGKIQKVQSLFREHTFGYADHTAWNEENNELITLLILGNRMRYVEKHVTIAYGNERCDYSSAISIEMFNQLSKKIKILEQIYGNGSIELNKGEKAYSLSGPMKMAAIAKNNITKGEILSEEDVKFCRINQLTKMSQIDVINAFGLTVMENIKKGSVIDWNHIEGY